MALARWLLGVGTITLVAGCFDIGGGDGCNSGANGLAGNIDFTYECSGSADPQCDNATANPPQLPIAIARGARFRLRAGEGTPVPVSPNAVSSSGQDFLALRAGHIGFVVSEGAEAIDAVRLEVVEPRAIVIARPRGQAANNGFPGFGLGLAQTSLDLTPTGSSKVRAIAMKSEVEFLAGTIPVHWSIDTPDIASFEVLPDGTCFITAHSEGHATLTATMDALSAHVEVRVTTAATSNDAGVSDAGSDAADLDASDAAQEGDAS